MISLEEMRKAELHNIRLELVNGTVETGYCSYYMQSEDDEEEPAIFFGEHHMIEQSEIKSIEILD